MSSISYNGTIPNPADAPSADVSTMQSNAAAIATWTTQDHFGFNNNNGGWHQQVHLFNQSAPGLGGKADGVLYCNNALPFWQNAASATNQLAFLGANSIVSNGYITLGGLIFQWGSSTSNTSSPNGSVTFPLAFPNNLFSVQICVLENSSSRRLWHLNTVSKTAFTAYIQDTNGSSVANTFYWFAVGN